LKKFTQVLSYVVFSQVRRHVHKQITKRRYAEEKPRRSVFGKPVLFSLGLELTMPYSLVFWSKIFTRCSKLCLLSLAVIWAPNSSHKIGNKSFIDHFQGWREGLFVCETIWFFSWVHTHPFDLKFVVFCPNFSGNSYVEFQEKTIPGEFFRNFVQTKVIYPLPKLVKFHPTLCNFYTRYVSHWKNSHKYFHMLFEPKQGGTSINK